MPQRPPRAPALWSPGLATVKDVARADGVQQRLAYLVLDGRNGRPGGRDTESVEDLDSTRPFAPY